MDFSNAVIAGIPLVMVVIGLVEWVKRLGLQGVALNIAAFLIGIGLGVAYQCSIAVPVDFAGWFTAGIYGLALGLVGSGIYDAGVSVIKKSAGGGVG